MKITLFIVLFIFVNFSFLGQEIKLDSLKEAFAKTQKTMRKKYDPYYWSAFVLTE
jgi:hypothetical protein